MAKTRTKIRIRLQSFDGHTAIIVSKISSTSIIVIVVGETQTQTLHTLHVIQMCRQLLSLPRSLILSEYSSHTPKTLFLAAVLVVEFDRNVPEAMSMCCRSVAQVITIHRNVCQHPHSVTHTHTLIHIKARPHFSLICPCEAKTLCCLYSNWSHGTLFTAIELYFISKFPNCSVWINYYIEHQYHSLVFYGQIRFGRTNTLRSYHPCLNGLQTTSVSLAP